MCCRLGKRLLDLAIAIVALIILLPVMALVALLVHLKLGSPVLFCQRRPGLHGKPFTIYKIRATPRATYLSAHTPGERARWWLILGRM